MYRSTSGRAGWVDEYTKGLGKNLVTVAARRWRRWRRRARMGVDGDVRRHRRNNREEDVTKLRHEGKLKGRWITTCPVLAVRGGDGKVIAVVFATPATPPRSILPVGRATGRVRAARIEKANPAPRAVRGGWCALTRTPCRGGRWAGPDVRR